MRATVSAIATGCFVTRSSPETVPEAGATTVEKVTVDGSGSPWSVVSVDGVSTRMSMTGAPCSTCSPFATKSLLTVPSTGARTAVDATDRIVPVASTSFTMSPVVTVTVGSSIAPVGAASSPSDWAAKNARRTRDTAMAANTRNFRPGHTQRRRTVTSEYYRLTWRYITKAQGRDQGHGARPSGTRAVPPGRGARQRYASMTTGTIIGRRRCLVLTQRPTVRRTTCWKA